MPHLPEFDLVAVCTAHPETARASAERYGVPMAFHDHREMLKREDINAVAVVVRIPLHYQLTMDALRAGKHVYTECPFAANLGEAEEMASLARQVGVQTVVGLQGRVSPVFLRVKQLIDEGYVGKLLSCHFTLFLSRVPQTTSDLAWQRGRSLAPSVLNLAFGHSLDCFRMCVGDFEEVNGVVATTAPEWYETDTGRNVPVEAPDHMLATGRLVNGAVASVQVIVVPWHAQSPTKMEVFGQDGTLTVTMDGFPQVDGATIAGGRGTDESLKELAIPHRLALVPKGVPLGPPFNVARLYQRFARAIGSDQREEPDFDTAVDLHRLLDTIQESSDRGVRLTLPT